MSTVIAVSDPRRVSAPRSLGRGQVGMLAAAAIASVAWLVSIGLELTGNAAVLHHHALIQSGELPLWLGIPLFLVAWQVMVASMMLPASLRAVGVVAGSRFVRSPAAALLGFLGAYALVWSGFGLAAFVGDIGLHALVAASPWLQGHLWAIPAATLFGAGAYQLVPWRVTALEACRHPSRRVAGAATSRARCGGGTRDRRAGFRVGLAHAFDCLASSWALMLLMFAVGVANLGWMASLASIMAYEALAPNGRAAGQAFAVLLLVVAALVVAGVPAGF
jgi:predicted metal-binding membrane protein